MMQEAASRNADVYGWGPEVLDQIDTCWLLLRVSVRMEKRPSWLEKISVETWSRGTDRLYFLRDFIFYDEAGAKIGAGTSIWILANKSTHRPVRPAVIMDMAKVLSDKTASMSFNPPKITPQADNTWMAANLANPNTIVKYADFSEIDRNHHVNNTRYVAWCLDAAHNKSLEQGDVLGIDINYNSEIHFGEKVILFRNENENHQFYIDGYVAGEDRIAFSAILYIDETICSK
jgi:acyl-ACP thioesterase